MATITNPLLKTLTISPPKLTLSPHFTPSLSFKPYHLTLPINPIKTPTSLSLFTTFVAQKTTHWDPLLEQDTTFGAHLDDHDDDGGDFGGGDDVESGSQRFDLGGGFTESEIAKLFVGNLCYDVDHDELAQVFEAAGEVQLAQVIYNRDSGTSRGFGFVTMSTLEEVEKAEQMFNGYELKGRNLVVNKAAPKGSRVERPPREYQPSFKLFVGNLPWNVDSARLEQVFSKYGEVVMARVLSDKETGRSRGFGFVTMASESGMNDAIAALDGQTLDGRTIRVDVAADRPRF